MKRLSFLLVACLWWVSLIAQETREGVPSIFLDCPWGCDMAFLRQEMTYVNFVRDRAVSDVFIQQTYLETGGGGLQSTLNFFGNRALKGRNDTLVYVIPPAASESVQRDMLKANLERGLLPYLLRTEMAERITFSVKPLEVDENAPKKEPVKDPWNYWTLRVNSNMNASGQEVAKNLSVNGGVSAQRITNAVKSRVFVNGSYNHSKFDFGDGDIEVYNQGGYSLGGSQIYSISKRWSMGMFANAGQSLYNNTQLSVLGLPVLEFNIFPYTEATRRLLTIQYGVGARYNQYFNETIYFKNSEWLGVQNIGAYYSQVLTWGSFNTGVGYGNYLQDWNLNEINFSTGIELNLFKGFNFSLWGSYDVVHNQIELPGNGASKEEALLAIRQLQTGYNYYMWCGISYTFGSIYSNVVNPRLDNRLF